MRPIPISSARPRSGLLTPDVTHATLPPPRFNEPVEPVVTTTTVNSTASAMDRAVDAGAGIVRLAPAWVPRSFFTPGRASASTPTTTSRWVKNRGGIDERWLGSTVRAENGPLTGRTRASAWSSDADGRCIPFDEFVGTTAARSSASGSGRKRRLAGVLEVLRQLGPMPLHMHQRDEQAAARRQGGQAGGLLLPAADEQQRRQQLPLHVHGLSRHDPGAGRAAASRTGTRATTASLDSRKATGSARHRLGHPAGVLHAPGQLCTYEPQRGSDVFGMYESSSKAARSRGAALEGHAGGQHGTSTSSSSCSTGRRTPIPPSSPTGSYGRTRPRLPGRPAARDSPRTGSCSAPTRSAPRSCRSSPVRP